MHKKDGLLIAALLSMTISAALAGEKAYGPGVTDTEIKIGNLMPYSGPASVYAIIARIQAAYFKKINDEGGINGRMINFISYDDAYSPPKAVEQTRKLVESDEVSVIFGAGGTATNTATMKYLNQKHIPQLFLIAGAAKFADPQNFPWTMGLNPHYRTEATIYGKRILSQNPNAKVAIFYQNDDLGRDYLAGLIEGLGDKAKSMLVSQISYETSEPSVASSIVRLKDSGADTLVIGGVSKFATQAIKTAAELSWKPQIYLSNTAVAIDSVLVPAGLQNSVGIISAAYRKDPGDPLWADDRGMKEFLGFMNKYYPSDSKNDQAAAGYLSAQILEHVLRQCGDVLTRENIMKQAASIKDVEFGLLLPGIKINTSETDYIPIDQFQLMRFSGERWVLFGPVLSP